ncbi:MAG: hypothetical protein JO247_19195 [Chloroflexi bacterium]|nr:hypothetical protein [Chloroflexota bacterium]
MKYLLMFCTAPEDKTRWNAMSQAELGQLFARVETWQEANASRISFRGYRLQGPDAATTVRQIQSGKPLVTDGPFVEAHEVISGFLIAEVTNLDEALAMAKSFPACSTCEIRPVLE